MYPSKVNKSAGIFVHNQVKELVKLNLDIRVVVPVPYFPFYFKWAGFRKLPFKTFLDNVLVYYIPTLMFPGGFFFSFYDFFYKLSLLKKVLKIREEFPFNLIHCHTIFPDGAFGVFLKDIIFQKYRVNIPVVSTLHGSDIMIYPSKCNYLYNKIKYFLTRNDYIIAVSKWLLEGAKSICPTLKGKVIYNGFDRKCFFPMEEFKAREELCFEKFGLDREKKIVLFIGNLFWIKGILYLVEAFSEVYRSFKDVNFVIVGTGPLHKEILKRLKIFNLEDVVFLVGKRPYKEIPLWLNSATVLVIPSLSEGLSSVLVEAMGCRKPIIITDVGGMPELIENGKSGIIVCPQNVELLSQAMLTLLKDEELAAKLAQQAFLASLKLDIEGSTKKIFELYNFLSFK